MDRRFTENLLSPQAASRASSGFWPCTKRKPQKEFVVAIKLFVGGLSFSTSSERLREAFAAVGAVDSASVVTDRDSGRSRGFGFVEMTTSEEASEAVRRLNGTELDGRQIKVEIAKPSGSGGGAGRGEGRGGYGGGRGGSRGSRW